MDFLTTDAEISAAVTTWLDAHPFVLPKDAERVARFLYGDGTDGSIVYRYDSGSFEHETTGRGAHFVYSLTSADRIVRLMFTLEFFRDCALPVIPLLHRDATKQLMRLMTMSTVADSPRSH